MLRSSNISVTLSLLRAQCTLSTLYTPCVTLLLLLALPGDNHWHRGELALAHYFSPHTSSKPGPHLGPVTELEVRVVDC